MKMFALRASDYMRSASAEDRRYLLYNPMVKMKVTTQGEEVINLLWDVVAAKGFEKDMYFEMAARDIRALRKLEGTVHVNMALIIKFMPNYFFNPAEFADIPIMDEPVNDDFLFNQGATRGLGKIQFHDIDLAYNSLDLPDFMIRDFSKFALQLYSKSGATNTQMALCLNMIRKPVNNAERFDRVWNKHVAVLDGAYEMNP